MGVVAAVDVGGTFTDIVVRHASGAIAVDKVPSTPENQAMGFMAALAKADALPPALDYVIHGTTVATNAVLEGKGARVGMLITSGFRDVPEIGRGERSKLYDLTLSRQPPLVPRSARFAVVERTSASGSVLQQATRDAVAAAYASHRGEPFDAWVVCFLHSYANPSNEECAAAYLREIAGEDVPVTISSEVVAEYREYERFSTAVLNAFVAPVMNRYLSDIETRLADSDNRRRVFVMQSSGGIMTARAARRLPAATMLSGPAGGVAGAMSIAARAGIRNFITCDMGGTSTDVCLIKNGEVKQTTEAKIAGYPTRLSQLDIVTVGAGGGSIASVGVGKVLRVGPQSAGARPGPACYGLGGDSATVTDANLVLNRLDADVPLSGEIALHTDHAWKAIERLAAMLGGLDVLAMAEGIIRLAVVRMAGTIRQVSVHRGHNPRDFALFAFGGAGPLVASELATELGMIEVVIPPHPGNLSALGLLLSPFKRDLVRTRIARLVDVSSKELATLFAGLEIRASREFEDDGVPGADILFHRSVDLRYIGQSFTLNVPSPGVPEPSALEKSFHVAHRSTFGHAAPDESVELVNVRLSASIPGACPSIEAPAPQGGRATPRATRPVFFRGDRLLCPVYERTQIPIGAELPGPLIVEERGASTLVWPGDRLSVDPRANLRVCVGGK